jgi:hypothetical protein
MAVVSSHAGEERQEIPASGTADQVPDRPSLAPGVELSGEMEDSAFHHRQWLAQRDGQFIQLTELLYQVAQRADGDQTLEEIAAAVAEETARPVSAANIRHLIATRLIPKGLIVKADGTVEEVARGPRSPLQINMKKSVVSPRMLNPLTAVLQYLYLPPIVVLVLLATGAGAEWLYFVHGIAGSIRNVLYEPALMLLLIAMIILVTAFHELGHASALRYGGGQVRGMGVGFYLVYPAFYTDVTENYRLSRWARVRTDLGGFYFNLLFALAMLGLWVVTDQEFLLLVAFLAQLEIVHQCLPFVRLDGYWALADMTGVPDFFSQIVPFLRTVLPLPWWNGPKLPPLKLWVKVVFGAYILITVPLLALMMFLMVKGVPRILATAWDSLSRQGHLLELSYSSGDAIGVSLAAVQMLILGLPTLGLIFVLFTLFRRLLGLLWRWSKPTPARRVVGALASVGLVSLLAFLWAPQIPFGPFHMGPAYAEMHVKPLSANEKWTLVEAARSFHLGGASVPPTSGRQPLKHPRQGPSRAYRATAQSTHVRPTVTSISGTPSTPRPTVAATLSGQTPVPAAPQSAFGHPTPSAGTHPAQGQSPQPASGLTSQPTGNAQPTPTDGSSDQPTDAPTEAPTDVPTAEAPTPTPTPEVGGTPTSGATGQTTSVPGTSPAPAPTQVPNTEPVPTPTSG